jgi:hypothetical protein
MLLRSLANVSWDRGNSDRNAMIYEQLFLEHLLREERILWCGRPEKSVRSKHQRRSWGNILVGLWFLVPGTTVIVIELVVPQPWFGYIICTVFGLLFILAGLSASGVMGFLCRKCNKRESFYAVTDRRALVLSTGRRTKFSAMTLASIKGITPSIDSENAGSLVLVDFSGGAIEFTGIKEVGRVQAIILEQQSISPDAQIMMWPECGTGFRKDFALSTYRKNAHGMQLPGEPKRSRSGLVSGTLIVAFGVSIFLGLIVVPGAVILTMLVAGVGLLQLLTFLHVPRAAMLGIGVALLVAAGFGYAGTHNFVSRAACSEGTVVEMVEHEDYEGDTYYVPIIEFWANDKKVIRFAQPDFFFGPRLHLGSKVDVLYSPASPSRARVRSWAPTWGWSIVSATFGLVAIVLGLLKSVGRSSKGVKS